MANTLPSPPSAKGQPVRAPMLNTTGTMCPTPSQGAHMGPSPPSRLLATPGEPWGRAAHSGLPKEPARPSDTPRALAPHPNLFPIAVLPTQWAAAPRPHLGTGHLHPSWGLQAAEQCWGMSCQAAKRTAPCATHRSRHFIGPGTIAVPKIPLGPGGSSRSLGDTGALWPVARRPARPFPSFAAPHCVGAHRLGAVATGVWH